MLTSQRLLPASDLRGIRRNCRPRPLAPDELSSWWVDTREARNPNSDLRSHIETALSDLEPGEHRHILVSGHSGAGKSTELVKLGNELDGKYLLVTLDAWQDIDTLSAEADDVVVAIAEALARTAAKVGLKVNPAALESVRAYFDEVTDKETAKKTDEFEAGTELKLETGLPFLAKALANIKASFKFKSDTEHSIVRRIKNQPQRLLDAVNTLAREIELASPGRPPVVIFENLDKLDISRAHSVFIENVGRLSALKFTIIFTIPIFVYHSPDFAQLSEFEKLSLPMMNTYSEAGRDAVKSIIYRRIAEDAIEEAAVDLLISKTGGVIRHVFECLNTAANKFGATLPLSELDVRVGLDSLKRDFYGAITLPAAPIAGVDKVELLYVRLAELADKDKRPVPLADSINQILLQSQALLEYNGKGWVGVHPIVVEILQELGRI